MLWRHFQFILWELTSHCGRSQFLLWIWFFGIFIGMFGLIYAPLNCPSWVPSRISNFLSWIDPQLYIDDNTYHHPFWTPIYFSIVVFTSLGFGDIQPNNGAGLFWVSLEVITGYVMLGILISITANKLARRA